ncbi:MAG: SDR family NAD(P)-dependent oxidoreductase [Bacteroidales bacterium]|nr:SDR family NAD(P)-dependent oxidoreductase [Bacteroidales bacterium]
MTKKTILITGASSGIGYNTAMVLAEQGHKVYAAARRVEKMEPLRQKGVIPIKMDVTSEDSIKNGLNIMVQNEKSIDVLINNAGYGYFGAIENVSMEEAHRQLEVNVFGLARLCQLVLPIMRQQGAGRIINTSSVAGKSVLYFGGWYHVSKYAVEAFSDALRMEMKPFGIDVILIEPGGIKTEWGIIAAQHLAESSKGTTYEQQGLQVADSLDKVYHMNILSQPKVVTKAICKAVNSKYPRVRYRVGFAAATILILHNILPARWWDALMRTLFGKIKI